MDDSTKATARNGGINSTSAESHPDEQPLPNETMNRTTERTCTQKLTIGKARLHQCKHVVAEVCTVHKDDKRPRLCCILTKFRYNEVF